MTYFDARLLERFRYLALLARRAGGRCLLSTARAKLPAGGTEATALRDYAPGDDYRHVDWLWCARRDELLTKVFEGYVDQHAYLLLDCSASMGLGRPPKFELARRVAAVLGHAVLTNLECLRVAAFADRILAELPPLRGRHRTPLLFRFLDGLRAQGGPTDLARAAESLCRRRVRPGPLAILSDLYDPAGIRRGLDMLLHRGFEPRIVRLIDPRDAEPGLLGDVELLDVESGRTRQMVVTERVAARYRQLLSELDAAIRDDCSRRCVPLVPLRCDAEEESAMFSVLVGRVSNLS